MKYKYLLSSIIFIISIIIVSMAVFIESQNPKIIETNISSKENTSVLQEELSFTFNRPMKKEDFIKNISISPQINYEIYWSKSTLFIKLKDPLKFSTNYTVFISKESTDIFNKKLEENFSISFKTNPSRIAYIQNDLKDSIVISDIELKNTSVLAEKENIQNFKINSNYLVYKTLNEEDRSERLFVKNLENNIETEIESDKYRINNFDIIGSKIVYNYVELVNQSGILLPKSESKIRIYEINENVSTELIFSSIKDIVDVQFTPSGESILLKDSTGNYYLTLVSDTENFVALGAHISFEGFSNDAKNVLFIDLPIGGVYDNFPSVSVYNSNRDVNTLNLEQSFVIDPKFLNDNSKVIFARAYSELEGSKGLFQIELYDINEKIQSTVLKNDGFSLELPKPRIDDSLVLIEKYTKEQLKSYENLRNYGFQVKPEEGQLIIYDLSTGKIEETNISGAEFTWVY